MYTKQIILEFYIECIPAIKLFNRSVNGFSYKKIVLLFINK